MRRPTGPSIALCLLVAGSFFANLWLIDVLPTRKLIGDEKHYASVARQDSGKGLDSLLPGRLRFGHRPSFHPHVLSQIGPHDDTIPSKQYIQQLMHDARLFHSVLFVISAVCVYAIARQLGINAWLALVAPLLLICLPRAVFHVHSLWAESLHMCFETIFLAATCAAMRGASRAWLVLAGATLGFAVLTRGTLLFALPLTLLLLFLQALRIYRGAGAGRVFTAPALLFGAAILVVGPQYLTNWRDGDGWRLAHNSWRNIEYGLRRPSPGEATLSGESPTDELTRTYMRGEDPSTGERGTRYREQAARQRVRDYVASLPWHEHVKRQWLKLWDTLLHGGDSLQIALARRAWQESTSAQIAPFARFDIVYWQLLVALSLIAVPFWIARNAAGTFIVAFFACYLGAFSLVSFSGRLAFQLAPVLCVLSTGALAQGVTLARGWLRRSRQSGTDETMHAHSDGAQLP